MFLSNTVIGTSSCAPTENTKKAAKLAISNGTMSVSFDITVLHFPNCSTMTGGGYGIATG